DTVRRLASERGITVIHITHFMHEVSAFKRVIVMDEGRVVMDGTPADVFTRADELRSVGLDVPMVTRLGQRLRAQGWTELPQVILSIEELKETGSHRPPDGVWQAQEAGQPLRSPLHLGNASAGDVGTTLALARDSFAPPLFELQDV